MHTDKGICRQSLVPIRKSPSDQSEMVSQLLFGEHYTVLETSEKGDWLHIQTYFDNYLGWIDAKQHYVIPQEYFEQINISDYKVCIDITSQMLYNKARLNILMGSIIPISNSELFDIEEKLAFNGEAKGLGQRRDFEYLRNIAFKYLNAPYLWGGKSPFGIDCSGFVQIVYKISGYKMNRDASQQARQGREVSTLSDSIPGDLAFFGKGKNKISHVGIIIEDSKIIHASGKVRVDGLDEKGIIDPASGLYTHNLKQIRNFLKSE